MEVLKRNKAYAYYAIDGDDVLSSLRHATTLFERRFKRKPKIYYLGVLADHQHFDDAPVHCVDSIGPNIAIPVFES